MGNRLRDLGVRCQHPDCTAGAPAARYRSHGMSICRTCYEKERAEEQDPLLAWLILRGSSRAAEAASVLHELREKLGSDATQAEVLGHARALGPSKLRMVARGLAELLKAGVVVRGLVVRSSAARSALGLKPKRPRRARIVQSGAPDRAPECTERPVSDAKPTQETSGLAPDSCVDSHG